MSQPFDAYAEYYDLLYREKDYAGEAAFISELIHHYSAAVPGRSSVLDLACGTGRHAIALSNLGFDVEGSDISESMLAIAVDAARAQGKTIQFHNESFQTSHRINKVYDVVVSMFSAFDYLTTSEDLIIALRNIRSLLRDGGLFVFDYWNGTAVVETYSPVKVLRKKDHKGELLRISETSLDTIGQIATVQFTCLYWAGDKKVEFSETHSMRYHYFAEMELLLHLQGFEVVHRCPFLDIDGELKDHDWNISIVARKRKHPG